MTDRVYDLRLEHGPVNGFVNVARPRVSWKVAADTDNWHQDSAALEWISDGVESHAVGGADSVLIDWPFSPLSPRQEGTLRVRVTNSDDVPSEWSEPVAVRAGMLGDGEWSAEFVSLHDPVAHAQPFSTRVEFVVDRDVARATLYATAHGVYQAELNGVEVDDQVLKPGWTSYQHRLIHETTDITSLLRAGANAFGARVAGGWFTENYGFMGNARPFYGTQPAFAAQILVEYADGTSFVAASGEEWRVRRGAGLVSSGIYLGEEEDARARHDGWSSPGFDETDWERPAIVAVDVVPEARVGPVVRRTEMLPVAEVITSPSGARILDFGQNLVGRLRIRVAGSRGDEVTMRHAEVLEDGELGVRPLRLARSVDRYTLAGGGPEEWEPAFTFHGFRYAQIDGWPGQFDPADVQAIVIHSDMERTGWFESSNQHVNRLHENIVWGMRGNFLYLPTDCPQRDERLGWTGDIQVFSPTASYLYDCNGFLASWLRDLAAEQTAGGGVPFIVPDVLGTSGSPAAAWGDAATVVPSILHERFGDVGALRSQFDSMRGWVDQVLAIAGERRLWEGRFQFGDWLDPDAPPDRPEKAKTDADIVASAYLFRSAGLVAEAAEILGYADVAKHYRIEADSVRQAWLQEYTTASGRIVSDAQTAYALAICFEIELDPARLSAMGARLAWLVRRNGYHIGTGFVGRRWSLTHSPARGTMLPLLACSCKPTTRRGSTRS